MSRALLNLIFLSLVVSVSMQSIYASSQHEEGKIPIESIRTTLDAMQHNEEYEKVIRLEEADVEIKIVDGSLRIRSLRGTLSNAVIIRALILARKQDEPPIRTVLDEAFNKKKDQESSCGPVHESISPIEDDKDMRFGITSPTLSLKRLCLDRSGRCKQVKFTEVCTEIEKNIAAAPPDQIIDFYGHSRSEAVIKKRMDSEALRTKILQYAELTFNQIKNNPEIYDQCCKNLNNPLNASAEKCKEKLKATKLQILKGLPLSDQTLQMDPNSRSVKISESFLISRLTHDSLERGFYHEFGHACSFARRKDIYSYLNQTSWSVEFRQLFGESAEKCVIEKTKTDHSTWSQKSKKKFDLSSWLGETHADALYMKFWKRTPPAFYLDCHNQVDESHGPGDTISCVFEQPDFQRTFCGGESCQ